MYYSRMSNKLRYAAFMFRWQDEGEGTRWRSTVQNVYTGEKFYFTDKDEMMHFLERSLFGHQGMDTHETPQVPHGQKEYA